MKKHILTLILSMASVGWLQSQTVLDAGDIAFVGINTSGTDDEFAFVLLKSISAETTINLTDCGWDNTTSSFIQIVGDSQISWKTSNDLERGTVVIITTYNGNQLPTANVGSVTGDNMLLSIAGDQVFAFQGDASSPRFIAAISFHKAGNEAPGGNYDGIANSNSTTELPPSLTIGENAVYVYNRATLTQENNSSYNGTVVSGNKNDLLLAINNPDSWISGGEIPIPPTTFDDFDFEVAAPTGIEDVENDGESAIKIYPNPTTDKFFVRGITDGTQISVFDIKGSLILKKELNQNESVSVESLPEGTYIIQLDNKNKISQLKLLVK